ncbi:MAG TPA: hypothetical protein VMD02_03810 [Candidatus Omnitrophota bacterium]|nr:hypothetical protein [Candidatus Omnitrophota bacterium]
MNILLWLLQGLLALWNIIGGIYVMSNYELIKSAWAQGLPIPVWIAYGALEVVFAVGLLWPRATALSAICLAVLSLLGCVLFAQYSGFPGLLWGIIPAFLAAFVAYGRMAGKSEG